MAQTTFGDNPVNWVSVGFNTAGGFFGLNPFTTAGMASSVNREEDGKYSLPTRRSFLLNTMVNGTFDMVQVNWVCIG